MTSSIEIMASSKPIIDDYELNKGYIVKYNLGFSELGDYYYPLVKHLFTMPYIYEVSGLHSGAFYEYLAQHMEIGDTLEIYEIPIPEKVEQSLKALEESPFPIQINVENLSYQNIYGTFKFNKKCWVEDLKHRKIVTENGITTIRK